MVQKHTGTMAVVLGPRRKLLPSPPSALAVRRPALMGLAGCSVRDRSSAAQQPPTPGTSATKLYRFLVKVLTYALQTKAAGQQALCCEDSLDFYSGWQDVVAILNPLAAATLWFVLLLQRMPQAWIGCASSWRTRPFCHAACIG